MGADATMAFFGLRFKTSEEENNGLEHRTDPRIVAARDQNLDHWWGHFSVDYYNEQSYLFIGKIIGRIGHEDDYEVVITPSELITTMSESRDRLKKAGFSDEPRLFVQFEPDF